MPEKTVVNITCLECGFEGKLSFNTDKFYPSDVCCCPICGSDISYNDYINNDDDDDEDEDLYLGI